MNDPGKWCVVIVLVICSIFLGNALLTGEMILSHHASGSSREITFERNLYEFIGLSIFYSALIGLCLVVIFPKTFDKIEDFFSKKINTENKDGIKKIKEAYRRRKH